MTLAPLGRAAMVLLEMFGLDIQDEMIGHPEGFVGKLPLNQFLIIACLSYPSVNAA